MTTTDNTNTMIECVSKIAAAYIAQNQVQLTELPALLHKIRDSLAQIRPEKTVSVTLSNRDPVVPIDESVFDDYIICLEDGKKLQMLKRHLSAVYGLTVSEYKARWNLPPSYPIVAPNYAKRRQEIAKTIGLGRDKKKKGMKLVQGKDTATGQEQVAVLKI